ncbi:hypothetical protein SprV_0200791000 [Sparganum proliferum]
MQQLSSGKVPGYGAIPAMNYKHGDPQFTGHLTELFQEMRRQGEVPQDYKDRIFTSHICLVGHLRIYRTETDEPVLEHQPTPAARSSNAWGY